MPRVIFCTLQNNPVCTKVCFTQVTVHLMHKWTENVWCPSVVYQHWQLNSVADFCWATCWSCVIYDLCTEEWGAQNLTLGDPHTQVLDVTDVDNWETEAALCEEVDQVKKKKKRSILLLERWLLHKTGVFCSTWLSWCFGFLVCFFSIWLFCFSKCFISSQNLLVCTLIVWFG